MPNITLSIPADLHKLIKRHPEIKWSEIARKALFEYAQKLEVMERLTEKSRLTIQDVEEIDGIIKERVYKRHLEKSK